MAFNPFHHFRRYNKVVFAALAIICMFVFVLSSGMGQGDAFQQLTDWFTNRRRIPAQVTLYGKEYDAREVDQVRTRRMLANEYMEAAVGAAQENLNNRVMSGLTKLDQDVQRTVFEVISTRSEYLRRGLVDFYAGSFLQNALYRIHFLTEQAAAQKDKKPETLDTLLALRNVLVLDAARFANRRPNELYFGGNVKEVQDTAEFLLWLHEADQLGIRLTDDDIANAIALETLGELTPARAVDIDRHLRERYRGGYSKEALYAALGDELRARLAQVAVAGAAASGGTRTRTAVPVALTPQESWELFKDARTTVQAGLITVPVESFVAKVTATPSDDELKKLFDKYRNDEPAPDRAEPGFKEPRRIQVEWVGASPELPFYQQAAARLGQVLPALRLLGATEPAALLGAPLALNAELLDAERQYRQQELSQPWTDPLTPRLHATSVWRPENVAMLVGAAVGAPNTGGTVLSGPLAMEARAVVREIRDRAMIGGTAFLTGAHPVELLGVASIQAEAAPKVPLAMIRGMLQEKAGEALARQLLRNDLITFRAELIKRSDKDRAEVRKFLDEFIKERGLAHGTTAEPRDRHNILTDPGLGPLKEAYRRGQGQRDVLLRDFGANFFSSSTFGGETTVGLFTPQEFFTGDPSGRTYLYWRTEDVPARTPTFAKARPQVVEAWQRLQARELARKETERLADLARRAQGDAQKLRDLAAQQGLEFFELGPMARRVSQPSPFGMGTQYQEPTIPADKIAYPGDELLKQVLGLRDDPKGTTVVVSDVPKKHFFSASLLQREEPTQDEFRRVYVNSMARSAVTDTLLRDLSSERLAKYYREVVQQLREQAERKQGKPMINDAAAKRAPDEPVGG